MYEYLIASSAWSVGGLVFGFAAGYVIGEVEKLLHRRHRL